MATNFSSEQETDHKPDASLAPAGYTTNEIGSANEQREAIIDSPHEPLSEDWRAHWAQTRQRYPAFSMCRR